MRFKKNQETNGALRFILSTMGKAKLGVVAMIVIAAISSLLGLLRALVMKNVINTATSGDRDGFIVAFMMIALLLFSRVLLSCVQRRLSITTSTSVANKLKARLTDNILHRAYADVTGVHSGEWMNRLVSDTSLVADTATGLLPGLTGMVVQMVGAVTMLIVLQPRFLLFALPVGIVVTIVSWSLRKIMKRMHKEMREADGQMRSRVQEILSGLLVVRAFSAEDSVYTDATSSMENHRKTQIRRADFSNLCSTGFSGVMGVVYLATLLFCGNGILSARLTYGDLTAILTLVGQVESPFAGFSGILPRFYAMIASAERLMDVEKMEPDKTDALNDTEIAKLYRGLCAIQLKDITFGYRGAKTDILRHFNLYVRKGDAVAFTGQSGCGKSTVLKLLMSLYEPREGERLLVLSDYSRPLRSDCRRLFAYVPQGNHLMSGTIRDVLSFACPERRNDDEALNKALEIACASDFVARLKEGLDSKLGEHGCGLSEGEMQRIAIARALFTDRPILLLDEATSALDENTERQLLINLHSMTDKTVLTVTHRRSVLAICDRVIEFTEDGCFEAEI